MKKFLLYTALFLVLCAVPCLLVLFKANGYTDPFYMRFTSPVQTSLVIGTSRAAQGIVPEVMNEVLNRNDIYNYSFTLAHSSYGPIYLNSIEKKLSKEAKNSVFILAVDPWSISSTGSDPNDESLFFENNLFLSDMNSVSTNPNIEYLLKHYDYNFFKILYESKRPSFLHADGWFEQNADMTDKVMINNKINDKIKEYRTVNLPVYKYSSTRLRFLERTIATLKSYGKVYLVRLPIHDKMMGIEKLLMPDFDSKMEKLASSEDVLYLNLTPLNTKFQYTDGNHLYKESSKKVSKLIAEWIKYNNEGK